MSYISLLVCLLVVLIVSQLLRIYKITSDISGRREEDLDVESNNRIANYMMLFGVALVVSFFWLLYKYHHIFLPEAATVHGAKIDWLMNYNLYLVSIVYVVFNLLLFGFARKYKYKKGVRASHFSHSNKLEAIWTVIPAVVMAVIIVAGIFIWNEINDQPEDPDAIKVQLYAKQFDWTARYAGTDNELGPSSFNFISGTNPLGVINETIYKNQLTEVEANIAKMKDDLANKVMGNTEHTELQDKLDRLERTRVRIYGFDAKNDVYSNSADDIVVKELVLPVNKEVDLIINSRDVIHSVWIPHFRLQMNAVPGMTTRFKFTPTITSKEMKAKTGNPYFTYVVMCNKICGASHYNMRMEITVVSEEEYADWLASIDDFSTKLKKLTAQN